MSLAFFLMKSRHLLFYADNIESQCSYEIVSPFHLYYLLVRLLTNLKATKMSDWSFIDLTMRYCSREGWVLSRRKTSLWRGDDWEDYSHISSVYRGIVIKRDYISSL